MASNRIGKLDFPATGGNARTPLLHDSEQIDSPVEHYDASQGGFFEQVAEGIRKRDAQKFKREALRCFTFFWAIVSCLCAGSITGYSLYAPLFQSHLHYNAYQVNIVSITAEIATYLPVPLFGLVVDRYGPRPAALFAALSFGAGYFLAAFTYHSGPPAATGRGDGWPFEVMVVSFVGIGMGTSCLYLAAVTTCAKNFARSKYKGFALAAPIASFGLSGMWQSQVGAHLLYERNADGSKGDVDVFKYFLFLGGLLLGVGLIGTFALRIIDTEDLINDAIEEIEAAGLLEDSIFFQHAGTGGDRHPSLAYGAIVDDEAYIQRQRQRERRRRVTAVVDQVIAKKQREAENRAKMHWFLNGETRRFLADRTMWLLAGGFFLVTGPGEAYINNVGTVIGTLYPPPGERELDPNSPSLARASPALHVSLIAIFSTVARLLAGTLSDLFAQSPTPPSQQLHPRGGLAGSTSFSHSRSTSTANPLADASQGGTNTTTTTYGTASASTLQSQHSQRGTFQQQQQHQSPSRPQFGHRASHSLSSSIASLDPLRHSATLGGSHSHQPKAPETATGFLMPRPIALLVSTLLLSIGFLLMALGVMQNHAVSRFWLVSVLVGTGYGAAFSIVPLIISCVWGVHNFATNWGITAMAPAVGAAIWGAIYAGVYQAGVKNVTDLAGPGEPPGMAPDADGLCYGAQCYQATFWGMAGASWLAMLLWGFAWKGPGGWAARGAAV